MVCWVLPSAFASSSCVAPESILALASIAEVSVLLKQIAYPFFAEKTDASFAAAIADKSSGRFASISGGFSASPLAALIS